MFLLKIYFYKWRFLSIVIIAGMVVFMSSCRFSDDKRQSNNDEEMVKVDKAYFDSITSFRKRAIAEFANLESSPLDSMQFHGHYHDPNYFPINQDFLIKAEFTIDTTGEVFGMATNTKRKPNYRVYGYLKFKVSDTLQKLTLYQNVDFMHDPEYGKYLFIPFRDKTNSKTTYGAGRYLEIVIPNSDTVMLDFNRAYNPYCAYSDRWSCPLVPFENHLDVYIVAGEMIYNNNH